MPTRRCCCPAGCIFARDLFERPNATTLGSGWTDPSSAFHINGGFAYMPSGDNVAIFNTPHVKNDPSGVAYYKIIDEVPDAIYYIIVNAVDANNYHIAKFHNIATPKIELGVVTGGAYAHLEEENVLGITGPAPCEHGPPNDCRIFTARIAPNEFCASIDQSVLSQVTTEVTPKPGGIYAGLGGSGTALFFDNFEFSEHYHTNTDCPLCICKCQTNYVTQKLRLDFVDATGRMSGLAGCNEELLWDRVNGWWSTVPLFTCCNTGWTVELYCPPQPGNPTEFEIFIKDGCTDSDNDTTLPGYLGPGRRNALEGSTCDPLFLRFGPFKVGDLDLSCPCGSPFGSPGEFYLEVTEI